MSCLALLPSPTHGVWYIGPVPIRAYALAMISAMVIAALIGARRLNQAGYRGEAMWDISVWAVPFGIVGARAYHVVSSPDAYFGPGGDPWAAFAIWRGGLGIWGAIALGAVGALIGARRNRIPFAALADALAPGLAVAQAVGRLGNWFNQELFGAPTTLPWGLQVSEAVTEAAGYPVGTLFHPTFLYELLWDLAIAFVLVKAGRRWYWGHGQTFFAYMAMYCAGRVWIEALRIDTAEHILGLRLNVWTSILVGLAGVGLFVYSRLRLGPGAPVGTAGDAADGDGSVGDGDGAGGEADGGADDGADDGAGDADGAADGGADDGDGAGDAHGDAGDGAGGEADGGAGDAGAGAGDAGDGADGDAHGGANGAAGGAGLQLTPE
ncbi:MAG: prolipoprotein diacylglyceryl transferase [Bifidobacteriaceae bacterium]|jgi:prolipoprotein diacylglyceryl transferase|nr:prolipoprotein diacylglyceryl transferase [Bifidobacteriaceae bacterium]